jgi:hypothetical protein
MVWLMIICGSLLRLIPHPVNFAPVSATALFGGVHLKKRYALGVPLAIMLVSNYLLLYINPFGNPVANFSHVQPLGAMFYSTFGYVLISFAISGLLGLWLRRHYKPSNVAAAAVAASLQFFLITNFGVWAAGAYARDLGGLFTSYMMGLPFLQWTLLGDLVYTGVFFGSYELARRVSRATLPKLAEPATEPQI